MDPLDLLRSNDSQSQAGAERLHHLADHESQMQFPDMFQYHSSSFTKRSVATSLCMFSGPRDFLHPCLLPAEERAAMSLRWGNPAKNWRGYWSATQQPPSRKEWQTKPSACSLEGLAEAESVAEILLIQVDPSSTTSGFTDFSKATPMEISPVSNFLFPVSQSVPTMFHLVKPPSPKICHFEVSTESGRVVQLSRNPPSGLGLLG